MKAGFVIINAAIAALILSGCDSYADPAAIGFAGGGATAEAHPVSWPAPAADAEDGYVMHYE